MVPHALWPYHHQSFIVIISLFILDEMVIAHPNGQQRIVDPDQFEILGAVGGYRPICWLRLRRIL